MYVGLPLNFKHYGTVSNLVIFEFLSGYRRSHLRAIYVGNL
jgi:hypothetical protein